MKRKYVFVLCPPHQGSTIILNLLNKSKNVSTFLDSEIWGGESQWLYTKYGDTDYYKNRWNKNYKLDMKMVDKIFNIYLDKSKEIWAEKSPPSICRAKSFQDYFSKLGEVYFIISIRNPYSIGVHYDANKWVEYAQYQKYNLENLNNIILTSYEECCIDLEKVMSKIKNRIPELKSISNNSRTEIKFINGKIIHLKGNERLKPIHTNKLNRITDKHNKNKILKKNIDLLQYFGYSIID